MARMTDSIVKKYNYDESTSISLAEKERLKAKITKNFTQAKIDKVEKLNNKYSYAAFMLKKNQNKDYRVIELIHSTAASNVPSIEKNNLNWRLVQRAKYGYGVSFSENADYANFHSSWSGGDYRAFIVCDVLVQSTKSVGDNKEIAPNGDCDTFQSKNGYVYVKFDDHTFILNTRYITINRAILFRHFIGVENANLRAYFDNSDNGF